MWVKGGRLPPPFGHYDLTQEAVRQRSFSDAPSYVLIQRPWSELSVEEPDSRSPARRAFLLAS
jgi:hypothetical protein